MNSLYSPSSLKWCYRNTEISVLLLLLCCCYHLNYCYYLYFLSFAKQGCHLKVIHQRQTVCDFNLLCSYISVWGHSTSMYAGIGHCNHPLCNAIYIETQYGLSRCSGLSPDKRDILLESPLFNSDLAILQQKLCE